MKSVSLEANKLGVDPNFNQTSCLYVTQMLWCKCLHDSKRCYWELNSELHPFLTFSPEKHAKPCSHIPPLLMSFFPEVPCFHFPAIISLSCANLTSLILFFSVVPLPLLHRHGRPAEAAAAGGREGCERGSPLQTGRPPLSAPGAGEDRRGQEQEVSAGLQNAGRRGDPGDDSA